MPDEKNANTFPTQPVFRSEPQLQPEPRLGGQPINQSGAVGQGQISQLQFSSPQLTPIQMQDSSQEPSSPRPVPTQRHHVKKRFWLRIAIIVGAVGIVAVAAIVFLIDRQASTLTCSMPESSLYGLTIGREFIFSFEGSGRTLSTTNYTQTIRPDSNSSYGVTTDEIYEVTTEEINENGQTKFVTTRQGDSVVSRANDLTKDELYDYAGLTLISIGGGFTRDALKNELTKDEMTCN